MDIGAIMRLVAAALDDLDHQESQAMPSLLNIHLADQVAALVDQATHDAADSVLPRDQAMEIIQAVLWLHSCRHGSTASVYASDAFATAIGEARAKWILSWRAAARGGASRGETGAPG